MKGLHRRGFKLFIYSMYLLIAVIVLFPLSWVVLSAFKSDTELFRYPVSFIPQAPNLASFVHVLLRTEMPRYLKNTIVVCLSATALTLAFAAPAAYGFSKYRFRLKYPLLIAMLGLQLIPGTVNIIPYYIMMSKIGLLNTLSGLILVFAAGGIPFAVWILKSFFDSLPDSLIEAARVDGASSFRAFWNIMLPLSLPGLGAAGFLRFFADWSAFILPMVIAGAKKTMVASVGLYNYFGVDAVFELNKVFAASIVAFFPIVVIYFFTQETFVAGLVKGSGK
jgi:ABC-type glycerol-3-phosphate transport system permease component